MVCRRYPPWFHSLATCVSPAALVALHCRVYRRISVGRQFIRHRLQEYLSITRSNAASAHVRPPSVDTSTRRMPVPSSAAMPCISTGASLFNCAEGSGVTKNARVRWRVTGVVFRWDALGLRSSQASSELDTPYPPRSYAAARCGQ